ncbi:hypothetical protein ACKKBG_A28000 [Auxenochlorella protothecoides x Auxenochlorella symbiontica]
MYDSLQGWRPRFRTSFNHTPRPATKALVFLKEFTCARDPGKPEWVKNYDARQREGKTSKNRRCSHKTGCEHHFSIKQPRREPGKSLVFYGSSGCNASSQDRNIRQAKRLNLWMLHQNAATSPMMTVQARRSDFPIFQHDEQGLADLVEFNENHQRVLRDYAHGCPVWIESTHGTSDLKLESLLMIAVESGNRVHCGSVALLRHERVWGIKEWLNVV